MCRRFIDLSNVGTVIAGIFDPLPLACGDGDVNGDGIISAAELLARRAA